MSKLPTTTEVLVVGGGPAGSTASTLLAREGFEVTLVERELFPRYHVGESLLPATLKILALCGARDKIEAHGFQRKPGAYFDWGGEQWSVEFGELSGRHKHSFQVTRAEFDELLLDHAKSEGVRVLQGVSVRDLLFDEGRPRRAALERTVGESARAELDFDYLIDASGRAGLVAARHLKCRRYHETFQNIAIWGYWDGTRPLEGRSGGAISLGSIPDGWLWGIPFSDGTRGVGVVVHKSAYASAKATGLTPAQIYHQTIARCPLLAKQVASARLVSEIHVDQDYSYVSDVFAGPGYFISGDAACFVDPLLSTGVHLASFSAMLAAAALASIARGEVSWEEAVSFYDHSYRHAYLRYMVVVSTFYDRTRGREAYFSEARRLSHRDFDRDSLSAAFLHIVSGVEDISDVEQLTRSVLEETTRHVDRDVELRQHKAALESMSPAMRREVAENQRMMGALDGMSSISPESAVDGLYVITSPRLGLARVSDVELSAAQQR